VNGVLNFIIKRFRLSDLRQPELICFDHLYSEYLSIRSLVTDEDERKFVIELQTTTEQLSKTPNAGQMEGSDIWSELYYFELIIAKYLPADQLRSKVMRLRLDYRAIAGQNEFDDYLASKPPDLQSPPVHTDPPDTIEEYEQALREDLRDLLGRIYLEYSILPIRETRLTDLTWLAAKLCLFSLGILLIILSILFLIPLGYEMVNVDADGWFARLNVVRTSSNLSSLTVFVVVVTGAMGGFMSALQRIQSPPTQGDSLYNLSLLFHGSKSVFVSPISGSIFAILLYLMFASGILTGAFFPAIYSPEGKYTKAPTRLSEGQNSTPDTSSGGSAAPAASATPTPETSPTGSPKPSLTPTASPTPKPVPEQGLNVFDFLAGSGPVSGKDYALLIIWCFIAGFAERFVPDALDRLISNENSVKGK